MKNYSGSGIARGIMPYVATILSISLALTLRVEHACSDKPSPADNLSRPAYYPYPEMISRIGYDAIRRPLGLLLLAQDLRPAIGSLLPGGFLYARGNGPDVAVGIHDPRRAIAPELILRRQ
jgi:hypothetical protein